ncbi:PAS domain-containing protein [Komagataeibacter rhaeticus]|nr:PAS domain-containing protein [Komagataeibacter rhaeticus]
MPDITRIASSLLEKLPLAVMMADVSGQVIYANACASRLTGYDPADREEKWLGRLFPEPMRPTGTPAAWDAHIAPPGAACGATRNGSSATLRRRDGLGLPVRLWREGVDWDGVPYELITFQDRTEEEQAREDGAISALIMQATDRGILVFDPQYRITHANRAVASLLGMTVDALRHAPSARCCPARKAISGPCASSAGSFPSARVSSWTCTPVARRARICGCAARLPRILAMMAPWRTLSSSCTTLPMTGSYVTCSAMWWKR